MTDTYQHHDDEYSDQEITAEELQEQLTGKKRRPAVALSPEAAAQAAKRRKESLAEAKLTVDTVGKGLMHALRRENQLVRERCGFLRRSLAHATQRCAEQQAANDRLVEELDQHKAHVDAADIRALHEEKQRQQLREIIFDQDLTIRGMRVEVGVLNSQLHEHMQREAAAIAQSICPPQQVGMHIQDLRDCISAQKMTIQHLYEKLSKKDDLLFSKVGIIERLEENDRCQKLLLAEQLGTIKTAKTLLEKQGKSMQVQALALKNCNDHVMAVTDGLREMADKEMTDLENVLSDPISLDVGDSDSKWFVLPCGHVFTNGTLTSWERQMFPCIFNIGPQPMPDDCRVSDCQCLFPFSCAKLCK